MSECAICGGSEFEQQDGFYYCSECATQSQDIRVEEFAKDDGASTYQKVTQEKKKKVLTAKQQQLQDVIEGDKGVTVFEKFQLILKMQADALVELGFDLKVKDVIRTLWFQYLKDCNYAFFEKDENDKAVNPLVPVTQPKKRVRNAKRRTKNKSRRCKRRRLDQEGDAKLLFDDDRHLFFSSSDSEEDGEDYYGVDEVSCGEKRKVGERGLVSEGTIELTGEALYSRLKDITRFYTQWGNMRKLNLRLTMVICFLALLYARQNFLPADLTRWAFLNKIPLYNLVTVLPKHMTHFIPAMFRMKVYWPVQKLLLNVNNFRCNFHLPRPPTPNMQWMCHTLVQRMKLPAIFVRMVDRVLACLYYPDFQEWFHSSYRGKVRYDTQCMSIVIVLLRVAYCLNDKFEIEQSLSADSNNSRSVTSSSGSMTDNSNTTSSCCCGSSDEGGGAQDPQSLDDNRDMIYVWSDWVRLHLESPTLLEDGIPLTQSQMERTRDYSRYYQFCRFELFTKNRPTLINRPKSAYDPQYLTTISDIFASYTKKVKVRQRQLLEEESMEEPHHTTQHSASTDDNAAASCCKGTSAHPPHPPFSPRLVPFKAHLLESLPALQPSERKKLSQQVSGSKELSSEDLPPSVNVPKSLVFVLRLASDLIEAEVDGLYSCVLSLEKQWTSKVAFHQKVVEFQHTTKKPKNTSLIIS